MKLNVFFKNFIVIFVLLFSVSSWAVEIFPIPSVYVGGAYAQKNSEITLAKLYDYNLEADKWKNKSYLLNVGVRPINYPVFNGFRIEAQYIKAFSGNDKDTQRGVVFYYDILKILPILSSVIPMVNPYVGLGMYKTTYNINDSGVEGFPDELNLDLRSVHGGVSVSIPNVPLDLFVEYRHINSKDDDTKISVIIPGGVYSLPYKIKSEEIMFGARYYILK